MRSLAIVPLLICGLAACGFFLGDGIAPWYLPGVGTVVFLAAVVGAFRAAAVFNPRERLFFCWLLLGAAHVFLTFARVLSLATAIGFSTPPSFLRTLIILTNIAMPLALWLFVRVWQATGLASLVPRVPYIGSVAIGIAIAVLAGGYPLIRNWSLGEININMLVSTLGDMISIALIIPLALPAMALRGGSLMPIWTYLATSSVIWLLYDLFSAMRSSLTPNTFIAGRAMLSMTAAAFILIAGIAQRRAVQMRT